MRPATRSVPKALLPVVDRPVIQWVVEEGMRAGVREFVVVVSPGVEDLLYSHFEGMGSLDQLEGFSRVRLTWVVQERALGLGHAVLRAREAVDERPFFCLLGDGLVVPGRDQLGQMAAASGTGPRRAWASWAATCSPPRSSGPWSASLRATAGRSS